MTIFEYVLAQVDARERTKDPDWRFGYVPRRVRKHRISIAGDLGGRAYTQRDARRKWARAA